MKITYNKDLKHMNTFGMKVKCACLVEYDSLEELDTLLSDERVSGEMPLPVFHIGGGSNLLFTGDFPGTILHSKLNFISYEIREKEVFVKAGSGVIWDDLCRLCSEKGFWGIENLSYIPGEVGAAAVQNIGAYGVEIKDVLHRVECYDCLEHKQVTFTNEECGYDYRDSKFKHEYKGRYIVTSVVLCLSLKAEPMLEYGNVRNSLERKFGKGNNITLQQVREVIIDIRKSKLPAPEEIGSAGSFFRNPFVFQEQYMNIAKKAEEQGLGDVPHFEDNSGLIKIPAAWLIEQCGFKGCRYGNAGVYEKQPLVLINATGNASPDEILALENKIIDEVKVRFGIILIPETEHI